MEECSTPRKVRPVRGDSTQVQMGSGVFRARARRRRRRVESESKNTNTFRSTHPSQIRRSRRRSRICLCKQDHSCTKVAHPSFCLYTHTRENAPSTNLVVSLYCEARPAFSAREHASSHCDSVSILRLRSRRPFRYMHLPSTRSIHLRRRSRLVQFGRRR